MSTTIDFIEYVCAQIEETYAVRYKKMFGEYMVYVNDKPVLLVCDNCVYVKKLNELGDIMRDAMCGVPYNGAKEHYILDIDNRDQINAVIEVLEKITPVPKKTAKNK